MKNFLFVVPRFVKRVGDYYFFPIGLGYVISYLKSKGFNVFCVNLCHSDEPIEKQIKKAISTNKIDVVCTGAMSTDWQNIANIVNYVRKDFPAKTIVVGGAIVTSWPDFLMNNMAVDYGVIGEGELTMAELAAEICAGNRTPENVAGIIFRNSEGNLVQTQPRESIAELDELPFPDYEALEMEKYYTVTRWSELPSIRGILYDFDENQRVGDILTSRSCPFCCTFCYHPLGKKYRQRSLENVFAEIDYLYRNYNIRILNVVDELFSVNDKRILDFCSLIRAYPLRWMAQWRVDNASRELFLEVKKSGVLFLGLGTESVSDTVLKSMKKHISSEQIKQAYKLAESLGIRANGNLIFGDVNETEETINESLGWFFENPQYDINLAMIKAVPDSEDWQYAMKKGLIKEPIDFIKRVFPIVNFSKISDKAFIKYFQTVLDSENNLDFLTPGKLISSVLADAHYGRKKIYEFKVECPMCKKPSVYKHYCASTNYYFTVICKHCLKRLRLRRRSVFFREPFDRATFVKTTRFLYRKKFKKNFAIRTVITAGKKIFGVR